MSSSQAYIYKLTDTRNCKIYIGKTNGNQKSYFTGGNIPRRIVKKYGKDVFKKDIIIKGNFNNKLLNELERHYIQLFNSKNTNIGYNLTYGGDGIGGLVFSEEHKKRISESNSGKIISEKSKKSMSVAKARAVCQYTLEGEFVNEYYAARYAERKTGYKNIKVAAAGKIRSCEGYLWIYKEDATQENIDKKVFDYRNSKTSKKMFPIVQIDTESLKILNIHDTLHVKELESFDKHLITLVCNGRTNQITHGGFIWRYKYSLTEKELNEGRLNGIK